MGPVEPLPPPAACRVSCQFLFCLIFQVKVRGGGGIAKSLNLQGGSGGRTGQRQRLSVVLSSRESTGKSPPLWGLGFPRLQMGISTGRELGLESGVASGDSPPSPGSFSPPG